MKKYIILVLTVILSFTACGTKEKEEEKPIIEDNGDNEDKEEVEEKSKEEQGSIEDYFPAKENTIYKYTGNNPFADQSDYIVYKDEDHIQKRAENINSVSTELYKLGNNELKIVYLGLDNVSSGLVDFRDEEEKENIVILREPLRLNNSWHTTMGTNDYSDNIIQGKSTITDVEVNVEVPAGEFECIEVTTEYETGNEEVRYYAKDIGLVKTKYKSFRKVEDKLTEEEIIVELSEIIEDTPLEIEMTMYYPDEQVMDLVEEESNLEFNTNDDLNKIFENKFKVPSENPFAPIITENTKVQSITVDYEKSEVSIDLSKDFTEELNAGSGYELLIQESLEYTLKKFYNVTGFNLTIDGSKYEPKH